MHLRPSPAAALAFALVLTLAGCGGGGAGGPAAPLPPPVAPTVPATPLAVTSATPAPATLAGVDVVPTITFDDVLGLNGVSGAVTLASPVGKVRATLSVNGSTVSLTPEQPLAWATRYQLDASTGASSAAGRKLGQAFSTSFSTRELAWSAPTLLARTAQMTQPVLAISPNGTAFATYTRWDDATRLRVVAARFSTTGKPAASPSQSDVNTSEVWTLEPVVAVNNAGVAFVVWNQKLVEPYYFGVMVARYEPGTGAWSAPVQVSRKEITAPFSKPRIAIDAAGNAVVAWRQYYEKDPGVEGIEAAYYTAATSAWSGAQAISANTNGASFPMVAMDAHGNAIAAWSQSAILGGPPLASAARYDAASKKWGAAKVIEPAALGFYLNDIKVDNEGNALALMSHYERQGTSLMTAAFSAATLAWAPAQAVPAGLTARRHALAMDGNGAALLAWIEQEPYQPAFIHALRWQARSASWNNGQGNPPLLEVGNTGYLGMLALSLDPAGNVLLGWVDFQDPNSDYYVNAARFSASNGSWTSTRLDTSRYLVEEPTLALDQSGQALIFWQHKDVLDSRAPFDLYFAKLIGQ